MSVKENDFDGMKMFLRFILMIIISVYAGYAHAKFQALREGRILIF